MSWRDQSKSRVFTLRLMSPVPASLPDFSTRGPVTAMRLRRPSSQVAVSQRGRKVWEPYLWVRSGTAPGSMANRAVCSTLVRSEPSPSRSMRVEVVERRNVIPPSRSVGVGTGIGPLWSVGMIASVGCGSVGDGGRALCAQRPSAPPPGRAAVARSGDGRLVVGHQARYVGVVGGRAQREGLVMGQGGLTLSAQAEHHMRSGAVVAELAQLGGGDGGHLSAGVELAEADQRADVTGVQLPGGDGLALVRRHQRTPSPVSSITRDDWPSPVENHQLPVSRSSHSPIWPGWSEQSSSTHVGMASMLPNSLRLIVAGPGRSPVPGCG